MKQNVFLVTRRERWKFLDILRGIAVIAMIFYHATWNLGYFNIISPYFMGEWPWKFAGAVIAISFLTISGVSLALSHKEQFRRNNFIKRLVLVGGAASLVSIATWYVMPEEFIFFGILHCLALTSILALPFLKMPRWACGVAAFFSLIAPLLFQQNFWNTPWLSWVGFGTETPNTNDYVPIFPWFSFVLLGLLLGQLPTLTAIEFRITKKIGHILSTIGRWSLVIYLVHQPILFGMTMAIASTGILNTSTPLSEIVYRRCESGCVGASEKIDICRAMCSCTVDRLTRAPEHADLWQKIQKQDTTPDMQQRIVNIARSCTETSHGKPNTVEPHQ